MTDRPDTFTRRPRLPTRTFTMVATLLHRDCYVPMWHACVGGRYPRKTWGVS
jgi:hypothetical protein